MEAHENYVLYIAKYGNFTKAAQALGVTQPALSSGLNSIERKLGFVIFNRKKAPITPTPEGTVYISYLRKRLLLEADFNRHIADLCKQENISISIGAPATYIDSLLLPHIGSFLKLHPSCKIRLIEGTVGFLSGCCQQGELDLFISTHGDLPDEFSTTFIGQEHVYLCIHRQSSIFAALEEHFHTAEDRFPAEILQHENLIALGKRQPLQQQVDAYLKKQGFVPESRIQVDQVKSALNLVSGNCGICFATSTALSVAQNREQIAAFRIIDEIFNRNIFVASLESNYLTELHKEFIHTLSTP